MFVQSQNPDGSWSPATPIGWQAGYDAEIAGPIVVRGHKHYAWVLYHDGDRDSATRPPPPPPPAVRLRQVAVVVPGERLVVVAREPCPRCGTDHDVYGHPDQG